MNNAVCLVFLSCLLTGVQCRSMGAPNAACDTVAPSHTGSSQTSPVPYTLSGLPDNGMYTPGMSYQLTLSGSQALKGLLVVALNSASERVGSWTPGSDSRTTCTDSRGITHTNADDKTTVSFTWTAPPEGTGEVQVRFAVVRVFSTFWANQLATTMQEAQPEPESTTSTVMTSASTSSVMTSASASTSSVMTSASASTSSVMTSASASTSSVTVSPSPSPDMVSSSSSSVHSEDATSTPSPSPTGTPESGGSNSAPSNIAGSLAAILMAAIAFVMVAVFA